MGHCAGWDNDVGSRKKLNNELQVEKYEMAPVFVVIFTAAANVAAGIKFRRTGFGAHLGLGWVAIPMQGRRGLLGCFREILVWGGWRLGGCDKVSLAYFLNSTNTKLTRDSPRVS
jgi:hypothetical protein